MDDVARFGDVFLAGELTPSGMRERFLLGRYNSAKYSVALGPEMMSRKSIWIESTDVHRTEQSGYSELLGLLT